MRGESSSRCARCLYYCRAGATFLFSHIGLCGLVVGYTIMGAFTFEALEANNEQAKRQEMIRTREMLVFRLWKMTEVSNVLSETNWTRDVTQELREFEVFLVTAVRKQGYDGNDENQLQWSFSGALLYSIIVITTIGYGNIAPKTPYGKVVTILYAIVGIPLMLLCLSNIGDAMAHSFKFIYWKVCCYLCVKPKKRRKTRTSSFKHHQRYSGDRSDDLYPEKFGGNSLLDLPGGVAAGGYGGQSLLHPPPHPASSPHHSSTARRGQSSAAAAREVNRTSSYGPGAAGSMRRASPPPFGSLSSRRGGRGQQDLYNERVDASRVPIITNKYVMQGPEPPPPPDLPTDPAVPSGLRQARHHQTGLYRPSAGAVSSSRTGPSPGVGSGATGGTKTSSRCNWREETVDVDPDRDDESGSEDESDEPEEVTVPIWLCLAIVVGYICGGAVLFTFWEEWNFLDSSYFCFVTLTTIGFGDLVPGTAVLSEDAQLTLGLCALYLLFGMALLAMSFNLVQEEVTKSVKCIGKRLGILSDDDEDD